MEEEGAPAAAAAASSATATLATDALGKRQRSSTATGATATTWVEDEKSWTEYAGMTVVARMERVKAALQEALARCEAEAEAEAELEVEAVLAGAVAALEATLPAELRPSLPWSAMVNLINAGLGKVQWAFPEGDLRREGEAGAIATRPPPLALADCRAALSEALRGVTHWLPNSALDHTATSTVDPEKTPTGPELSLEEYRAMWPLDAEAGSQPVLRVLGPDFPRRPYKARAAAGEGGARAAEAEGVADSVHWGQRKLFMNELELLTLHAAPGDTVVYAGAAPGKHIAFLVDRLFPELTFVLVDPAPFRIQPSARIRLVQGLMTDELAREYSSAAEAAAGGEAGEEGTPAPASAPAPATKRVIFVSDIRRTHASEDLILEDMLDQQRWHDILRPKVKRQEEIGVVARSYRSGGSRN